MLPYTERMASKYCVLRAGMDTNSWILVPAVSYRQICNLPEYHESTGLQIRLNDKFPIFASGRRQAEIAVHIGKSPRTVKRITPSLIERGLPERENGKRNGYWEIKINDLNR